MSLAEVLNADSSHLTRARAACLRLHGMKVGWRLVDVIQQYAGDFDEIDDDPEGGPEVVLSELRGWEVDLGKRAGIPPCTWIDRRVSRLTRGVRSSPPPASPNPAGTSSPQAQGGT
jgi:hypothetical protein